MFNYSEIAADFAVKSYVRKFWVVNNLNSSLFTDALYALPNGSFTLAFISGEGAVLETGGNELNLSEGIYFVGQITQRVKLSIKPFSKAVMAQLSPWAASLFTAHPQNELTDRVIEIKDVNKKLYGALNNAGTVDEISLAKTIYSEIENGLVGNSDASIIQAVFNHFNDSLNHTSLKMADLAAHIGFSKRYIEKKFQQHVGLSPKEAYSIMKVRRLIDELEARKPLTQLAFSYGYYDQSHFIKSYAAIMESSPAKFKKSEYILPF
jgi:AraC-like DNA-binding protein